MEVAVPQTIEREVSATALLVAMELAATKWLIRISDGRASSNHRIAARDLAAFLEAITRFRARHGGDDSVPVVACYEAGRDGFSVSRALRDVGVECLVVDSASIEIPRGRKQAKTDRLDVERLMKLLSRYWHGEKEALHVVREPTPEDEDARELSRERERLTKLVNSERNSIRSLLVKEGVALTSKELTPSLAETLDELRTLDGRELGATLKARLKRSLARLEKAEEQRREIDAERAALLKAAEAADEVNPKLAKVKRLLKLKGVGVQSAWLLTHELFWRKFNNREEVGAAAGLAPTPFASGTISREQGILKAGNTRVRRLMIELAWLWLRHQPTSALTTWFNERFSSAGGRSKRIGIVALARKLLITLWHFVEHGEVPNGAVLG